MKLHTESFSLEVLKPRDAQSLSRLMISNGRRFQQYLPKTLSENLSEADSKNYIRRKTKKLKNQEEFTFAIKDIDSRDVAGLVILKNIDPVLKQGEFAYCLGQRYSGKGWMTRSIKAAKAYAFNELKLETLQIIIHKSNLPSIQIALRNGFTWIKTLENEHATEDDVLDMELYELHYER
ncbi:N-acetyltransferase [Bizionia argentinensis JUB59]|uniref:N-acetyltransferase n=1 Tax=Bizionia argentinensis JUB59 TaxID=1046627 RepID=G2EF00_9FLAO|nr:GNAT family N-acetyltransferase [Bizionia argentinensis]EGV43059.1 N-acetyltransferase [Bizionia argentinensis JUB59]